MAVAVAGVGTWRWWRFPRSIAAALPATPDLAAKPEPLRNGIAGALAKARERATARDGVAELGRLYHANGLMPEAETCWQLLHRLEPSEARWLYYLADCRRAASDHAAANRLLQLTVDRAPDYEPAWLQLAQGEFKSGDLELAANDYRRRLALIPNDPHARLGLARVALQQGDRRTARDQLEELVRDSRGFSPAHNLLAELLAAEGETARAREHRWLGKEAGRFREPDDPWLNELVAWCHDPERLCVLGTMAYQTQRMDDARGLLEKAAQLAPSNLAIRTLLGELYLKRGDASRARETLETALANASSGEGVPVGFYLTLSEARRAEGSVTDALQVIESGRTVWPQSAALLNQRGLLLLADHRPADAMGAFEAAARHDPNLADPPFNVAMLHLNARRLEEGRVWLRRAIAAQPTHPQALTLLARLEMEAGRVDEAWVYLEPLYEANSGLAPVRELTARWYLQSGNQAIARNDVARAERQWRAGIAINPADPELPATLGVSLLTQGRFVDAVAPLESYHRLAPNNAQSALFLGQVYASVGRTEEARRVLTLGEQIASRAGQTATANHCREILRQL